MTQQEVIRKFMQSLNDTTLKGGAALNAAIKACSSFKSFSALRTQFLKDIKEAKNWHAFLVEKCGIILDNADTGAISGADAGGSTTKTAESIIPSTAKAKYPAGSSFTVDGLTIYGIPDKKFLTADQRYVITGLYSWWIKGALALIKESYGLTFKDVNTTNARLKLKFFDDPDSNNLASVTFISVDDEDKVYESRELCINMAKFKNMSSDNRHGLIDGTALDRTLVHELVHGLMASNVNYFGSVPNFLMEGGTAELIHGVDDKRYNEIIAYAKNPSVFEKILTTKVFESQPYEIYAGGYIFMRYLAKQAADTAFDYDTYKKIVTVKDNFATNYYDKVTMKGGKGNDTLTNSGNNVSIGAAAGNDNVKNYGDTIKISTGKGNDSVDNAGDNVKIDGEAGNDSLSNTGDNVSIVGGTGKDLIVNSISDYDVAYNLTEEEVKEEIITENGATVKSGSKYYEVNLIGGNKATLRGGDGNDTFYNHSCNALICGDAGKDIINNYGFNATVYGGADNDKVINSKKTLELFSSNVSLTGYKSKIFVGDGNDSIYNDADRAKLYGGNGNDTITNHGWQVSIDGGADVDSVNNYGLSSYVKLGAGDDIFVNFGVEATLRGGDGNDSVKNYADYCSLASDAGDDFIYSSGDEDTVYGGSGNDYLYNEGVNGYIIGGKGNDTIYNEGDHVTLASGNGKDILYNEGGRHITYEFGNNDGADKVYGFNSGDTVQITSGTHSAKKSGDNVIITVGNAKLTLINAVNKVINFISAAGKTSNKTFSASNSVAPLLMENNFVKQNDLSALIEPVALSNIDLRQKNVNVALIKDSATCIISKK